MSDYNPFDWFWRIGGLGIWSSKNQMYVAEYDESRLTAIDTEANLHAVLAAYGIPGPNPQLNVPTVVSMRQAVVYLIRNDLLDTVNAVVAGQGAEAIATWEKSQEVQRINPLLNYVLDDQGYSEADKDQMFIDASKL